MDDSSSKNLPSDSFSSYNGSDDDSLIEYYEEDSEEEVIDDPMISIN
jgi:hypothetical protein